MEKLEFGEQPVEPSFWFLKAPLYHKEDYKFDECDGYGFDHFRKNLLAVIFPTITIDVYCPSCQRETVFTPVRRLNDWKERGSNNVLYDTVKEGVHYAHFKCSRGTCGSDLYFVFTITDGIVTKIGQNPSIADLISPALKKYRPVIGSQLISDWQRAIGLRAHAIGAGSYVYLRRIIERMVNDASIIAIKDGALDNDQYIKSRWPEKIRMLSRYLPTYLVDNANVYSILSKGVHELSEEDCTDYFDVLNTAIEIICEEKLAKLERDKRASEGAKALQNVLQKLNT